MNLAYDDWQAIVLSIKLALVVTSLLIIISTPLAWWLANTKSRFATFINAVVALPLVLPPTVLGFYVLLLLSPQNSVGQFLASIGLGPFAFTFTGLVIASMLYSLPFVVQPIQNAFSQIDKGAIEASMTLRAGPIDRLFNLVLPMARPGYITAFVLGFAHTIGEFGVILMIGGNIPGETQVVSVKIYEHVEALEYSKAHGLAGFMVAFAFVVLLVMYRRSGKPGLFRGPGK